MEQGREIQGGGASGILNSAAGVGSTGENFQQSPEGGEGSATRMWVGWRRWTGIPAYE